MTDMTLDSVYIDGCEFGRGVFVARDFAAGAMLLTFRGPFIPLETAIALGPLQANPLQVDDRLYIDLQSPGVFVNHSCTPNAGIRDDVLLMALKPIRQGEEIRFDYSTTMWEQSWTMSCRCGSSRCRGVVRDFPDLPDDLQREYLRLGVVQGFIRRRLGPDSHGSRSSTP